MLRLALAFALLVLLLFVPTCSSQKVKLLLTGRIGLPEYPLPRWFMSEPLVDLLQVPSRDELGYLGGEQEMKRFIRLYFPRTFERLKEYDFFLMDSINIWHFEDRQVRWMRDAIREGSAGWNTCSVMSISSHRHMPWCESMLQEAFPNDAPAVCARPAVGFPNTFISLRVNREFSEPVLTPFLPLGVEEVRGSQTSWIIIPRPGARTMAYFVGPYPAALGNAPFIITWDYGEGRALTTGAMSWWSRHNDPAETPNPYGFDVMMNMVFYATRREVVTDVLVYHEVRKSLLTFYERMGILVSVIEFVDRVGADTRGIYKKADDLGSRVEAARASYLEQDFDAVDEVMREVFEGLMEAEDDAIRVKNRTFVWIFLIQWITVSGTAMICGFILWSLMIRRMLYREVASTRLR
jgi:hypothetical protein